jgi:glycosyltransferase involved in cell wall biosynthesis
VQRYNNKKSINDIFSNAKFIICISEDAKNIISEIYPQAKDKIIRSIWSIPVEAKLDFNVCNKEKLITYMPRKNIDHIQLTLDSIENKLPADWRLVPIVRMSRSELEYTLNKSSIHLSFGSFEGLPAPPVEAAIAGNYVIGYHGNGGREYWTKPNFVEVNVCDIEKFSKNILERVRIIDNDPVIFNELEIGINKLKNIFSINHELDCIRKFAEVLIAEKINFNNDGYRKTPFLTNYISYQLDRVIIKYKQISHGL